MSFTTGCGPTTGVGYTLGGGGGPGKKTASGTKPVLGGGGGPGVWSGRAPWEGANGAMAGGGAT